MIKILFVCHGNICRSPMAEFLLRDMVKKAGFSDRVQIASAAASREEVGSPVYPPARRILTEYGISCAGKTARQITEKDLKEFDRIYYMDGFNQRRLGRMFPDYPRFLPFLDRDVADPYFSGDFTQTWLDIQEGCERILEEIKHGSA